MLSADSDRNLELPATKALRTTDAMSGRLSGAMALKLARVMPMEAGFENPHNAYVAIILDLALMVCSTLGNLK